MSIFAIGDLHLPGGDKKPMDVFGAHWERHFERICADWQSRVKPEDIVLIPGDISWAMQLGDALNDLHDPAAARQPRLLVVVAQPAPRLPAGKHARRAERCV